MKSVVSTKASYDWRDEMFTVNIAKLNPDGTVGKAVRLTLPINRKTLNVYLMNLRVDSQNNYAYSILSIDASHHAFDQSIRNVKDIDELNYIAFYEDSLDQEGMAKVLDLVKVMEPRNSKELLEILKDWQSYSSRTGITDYEQLGRYAAELQYEGILDNILENHIDFEDFGEEFHSEVKGKFLEKGYLFNTKRLKDYNSDYLNWVNDGSSKGICVYIATMEALMKNDLPQGVWLYLPETQYSLDRALHQLGATSFEECIICDSTPYDWIADNIYEVEDSIIELNMVAERLVALDEIDLKKFSAIYEDETEPELSTLINILDNLDQYELIPSSVITATDYANYVLFESGRYDTYVDDEINSFVDYEKYGNYKMEEDNVVRTSYGMLRKRDMKLEQESGFEIQGMEGM
jgi:hypothetical protein